MRGCPLKRGICENISMANLPQFLVKTERCWSACNRTFVAHYILWVFERNSVSATKIPNVGLHGVDNRCWFKWASTRKEKMRLRIRIPWNIHEGEFTCSHWSSVVESRDVIAKSQFKPSFLSKVSVLQRSMILTVSGFEIAHIWR